ncbi:MAG: adenylate kinase [Tannerella sp.]|jgi:adenylate kinase|nr:adenylate kinase [Tannerella sp.]
MLNIVIFGAPGSGKGTQSDLIKERYRLTHISTGEVLREEIKNETKLGKTAKGYIEKGQLVPDDLICDILDKVLHRLPEDTKGVIFDGFPRTIPQAEALEDILRKHGWTVSLLLDLQVEDDELVKRLIERGKSSGRADDNEETIQSRLRVYHTQTAPLADHYRKKGKHVAIKGSGTIDDIFHRITEAISAHTAQTDNIN